jgi:hypothetical protein
VQKLASAAKISFAKEAHLQNHNQLLYRINNEDKVQRSTQLLVIGRVKVMSYKELNIACAAWTAKDKATAETDFPTSKPYQALGLISLKLDYSIKSSCLVVINKLSQVVLSSRLDQIDQLD